MSEHNWDGKFWDSVVSIAADDERLTRTLGCLLLDTERMEDEDADYGDLQEYLYRRYDTPLDRMEEVFDLCEARILGETI